MDYRKHYQPIFSSEDTLTDKVLAELFLFRAWTTQYAYRMFADAQAHDALITETVSSCAHLGTGIFQTKHGFSIEDELRNAFIELVEDRWRQYDDVVIENKDSEALIPARQLCGTLMRVSGVTDPFALIGLSADFSSHVARIGDNCIANSMFKPGRR